MKVSIIIPYKEDRGFLDQAIQSVKNQTYKDWEIIRSQSNNPVGYNFNKGFYKAKGDLICYLCDDDKLTPNSLQDRVEFMMNSDCDFMHSRGYELYQNGIKRNYRLNEPDVTFESCLESNGIMGGTTMYRRELFTTYRFDESLTTGEEWDFHLKLLKDGKKLGYLDKFTYIYRRHSLQKSVGNLSKEYQDKRREIKAMIRGRYA